MSSSAQYSLEHNFSQLTHKPKASPKHSAKAKERKSVSQPPVPQQIPYPAVPTNVFQLQNEYQYNAYNSPTHLIPLSPSASPLAMTRNLQTQPMSEQQILSQAPPQQYYLQYIPTGAEFLPPGSEYLPVEPSGTQMQVYGYYPTYPPNTQHYPPS